MDHPEVKSMDAFSRRALPPAEMLALSDHLAACEKCRERMEALVVGDGGVESFPAEDVAVHLSEEEIATAAGDESALTPEARAHVASCAECTQEIVAVRRYFRPVVVMQPRKAGLGPVWIGLTAAAILLFAAWMHRRYAAAPASPQLVAALRDGGGTIGLNGQGELMGTARVPPEDAALLAETLKMHWLPAPMVKVDDGGQAERLRGESVARPGFHVLAPLPETTTTTPEFRWQSMPQAESYRVEIYDEQFKLAAQSPAIDQTNWTAAAPLAPGRLYTWVVKAKTAAGSVQTPQPPEPEARFAVADAKTLAAIDAARRQSPESHLLLAALYARAGMTSAARAEMDVLAKENPGSALVRQLADSLTAAPTGQPPSSTKPAQ